MKKNAQHVFLVGAKSLGAYGGYETFVNKLTQCRQEDPGLQFHVACKANGNGSLDETGLKGAVKISDREFWYHNARCFKIRVPNIGAAQAIYYDVAALHSCCGYIRRHKIPHPIVYIMACRIGPFAGYFCRKIHALGGKVYLNPDGHEWMRGKWSAPVRKYWKISEGMMVRHSDLVICDSMQIEAYIHSTYDGTCRRGEDPKTTFIAYGAEARKSTLADDDGQLLQWYAQIGVTQKNYYLIVGRFVPENNYETMIREFMASRTKRDLVIITEVNEKFLEYLENTLHFRADPRIRFVGTVYDQELLMKIRENACGYFHGHQVGGTNPSLLESMASTDLNLLLDVGFNREVAEDAALYWTKEPGNLAALIAQADTMDPESIRKLGCLARERIRTRYSWEYISGRYDEVFRL